MKISLPFFVFETQLTINAILKVIFRSNPQNDTRLPDVFVPRKIETIRLLPGEDQWSVRIKMWANGVYVDAVSEGCADSHYGDQYRTASLSFKVHRYMAPQAMVIIDVPVSEILQAEKKSADGISEDDPQQIEARKQQKAALQVIHRSLRC